MSSKKAHLAAEETPTEPPAPESERAARPLESEDLQPSAPAAEAGLQSRPRSLRPCASS